MCRTTGRRRSSIALKRNSLGTEPVESSKCNCSPPKRSTTLDDVEVEVVSEEDIPCYRRVNNAAMRFKMFLEYAGENDQILAYERFERIFHRDCVFIMGNGHTRTLPFFKLCIGGLISLGCRTPKVEICLIDENRFRARFKVYLAGRNVVTPDRVMTVDKDGKVIRNEPFTEDAKCPFVKCLKIMAKS